MIACSVGLPTAGAADVSTRDWLRQSGDFEIFLQLAKASGVEDTLQNGIPDNGFNGGNITVFAPTDDAFRRFVDTGLLNGLDANRARTIVQFHIVPGRFSTGQLAESRGWTSLIDEELIIVNGQIGNPGADAELGQTDVATATGTVHVIDQVVIPYSLR